MARYDAMGRQIPNQDPVEVPLWANQVESLTDIMKRTIRQEFNKYAQSEELETYEEADDFDVDEDADEWQSPYELIDMVPEADHGAAIESEDPMSNDSNTPPSETVTPSTANP